VPVLDAADARALGDLLARRLQDDVVLEYLRPSQGGPGVLLDEAALLLSELALLDSRIRVEARPASPCEQAPQIRVGGRAGGRIRYLGAPAGYEFASLVDAIVVASSGDAALRPATRQALDGLGRDVHVQVFVTPTCPFCPGVADLAQQMAVVSPQVRADIVAADEFPDLADRFRVTGVPCVVVAGERAFVGAQSEARFLAHVARAGAASPVG
jgi:glutaredoxin-like protein